jgi:hypothetical protein
MPALTRRRSTDAREDCWHIYYGDVHAGTVCWLIANHLHLTSFESAPEVGAFCSAVIARPHPVRLPPWPPPVATLRPPPSQTTGLPRLPEAPSGRAVPTTPTYQAGARVDCFPTHAAFQMAGGSASALSLSRPAQASHVLRPTGSLSRPRRPLSRGSSPSGHRAEPLVSYQINRQFSGWILPPKVIRAFGAHCQQRTYDTGGVDLGLAVASCASAAVTSRSAISQVAACALAWSCTPREACRHDAWRRNSAAGR